MAPAAGTKQLGASAAAPGMLAASKTASSTMPAAAADTLSHKSVVEKQRAAIEKLRQQNARLKEDLLLENKFSVRPSNPGATATINKLQDEADLYTRKIQLERRKVLMLQQQLEQLAAQLGSSRSAMGSVTSAVEKAAGLQRQITIRENRLEKQYIKYNEALTYNKQLREQIDNLRRERLMFEGIDANLAKELARVKRSIADTITAANEAHAAKDRALAEVSGLKLLAEKEHAGFDEEWRQLTRLIEDAREARAIARQDEMAERERQTQQLLKGCEAKVANKKKAARTSWSIGMNKAIAQNVSHQKMRLFNEAFASIQAATRVSGVDALVGAFADAEEQSFKLFNFVTQLNRSVEEMEDGIGRVRAEVEAHARQAQTDEAATGAVAGSTAAARADAEGRAAAYEARLRAALEVVERLKAGVGSLFEVAGCETEEARELALEGGGLCTGTLLTHLSLIEQHTTKLLRAFVASKPECTELQELLRVQPVLPAPGHRIIVDAPSSMGPPPEQQQQQLQLGGSSSSGAGTFGLVSLGGFLSATGGGGGGGAGAEPASAAGQGSDDADEALPDDVPLTRAQLQAKVTRGLDGILERSLQVKAVPGAGTALTGAGAGAGAGGGGGAAAAAGRRR